MTTTNLFLRLASLLLVLLGAGRLPALAAAPRPPNLVMVLIDDMGWGDFSCFGNTEASTPNVDRLAPHANNERTNGPHNESNHNLARFQPSGPFSGIKRSLTDGGIRVPAIAW